MSCAVNRLPLHLPRVNGHYFTSGQRELHFLMVHHSHLTVTDLVQVSTMYTTCMTLMGQGRQWPVAGT